MLCLSSISWCHGLEENKGQSEGETGAHLGCYRSLKASSPVLIAARYFILARPSFLFNQSVGGRVLRWPPNPLPLSMGRPCKYDGIHSHDYMAKVKGFCWGDSGPESVDSELIKIQIRSGGSDLLRWKHFKEDLEISWRGRCPPAGLEANPMLWSTCGEHWLASVLPAQVTEFCHWRWRRTPNSRWARSLADTLTEALWDPATLCWLLTHGHFEIIKVCCFKLKSLW